MKFLTKILAKKSTPTELLNKSKYNEEYWALRKKFHIKNGVTLEPLQDEQQKRFFREQVKKLKQKYHIK